MAFALLTDDAASGIIAESPKDVLANPSARF